MEVEAAIKKVVEGYGVPEYWKKLGS